MFGKSLKASLYFLLRYVNEFELSPVKYHPIYDLSKPDLQLVNFSSVNELLAKKSNCSDTVIDRGLQRFPLFIFTNVYFRL